MMRVFKLLLGILVFVVALYQAYFFMLPSVTLINKSGHSLTAKVILPNSGLDFGTVLTESENTIYYSIAQADGQYQYQVHLESGESLAGSCGYVTSSEYHKRVTLKVLADNVTCH